jgi:hypothetical protein
MTEVSVMWILFKRKELAVSSWAGCGRVCDDAGERAALRDRVLLQQIWRGFA